MASSILAAFPATDATSTASALPPAPYPVDSSHKVTINGTVYDGYDNPGSVPRSAVPAMAQWLSAVETAYQANPSSNYLTGLYVNLGHSHIAAVLAGSTSSSDMNAVVEDYSRTVVTLPSEDLVPGEQSAANAVGSVESVADFLSKLGSSALWTRVGEFALGALFIGIGVHGVMKGNAGYDKTVGKAKSVGKLFVAPEVAASSVVKKAATKKAPSPAVSYRGLDPKPSSTTGTYAYRAPKGTPSKAAVKRMDFS